jgi:DNA replication initiation complex subunit (GINS family)
MNYDDLRRVQRLEKASSKMIDVPANFYFDLENMLKDAEGKAKSLEGMKNLENLKRAVRDVYERREQKILIRALRAARTGEEETSGMVEREKQIFSDLVSLLAKYRKGLVEVEKEPEKRVQIEEHTTEVKAKDNAKEGKNKQELEVEAQETEEEPQDLLKARVSKYIPQFITSQGKFGPFEAGAVLSLPREVGEVLAKKGYIEVIK